MGQLEADLTSSASDILRAVSEREVRTADEAAERAAAERLEAEQQLAALREEFERQQAELQRTTASEVAGLQSATEEVRQQLVAARQAIEDGQGERDGVRQQLEDTRHEAENARRAADERQRTADEAHRLLEDARHRAELAEDHADQAREALEGTRREIDAAREALAQADRLAAGLRALDDAASLGGVLEGLAGLARRESDRAAVFLVRGDRLRGWRAVGFETAEGILDVDLEASQSGVAGEAVKSGSRLEHRNGAGSPLPVFSAGLSPRRAVAAPVEVGGAIVAVLYAEAAEPDTTSEPRWPAMLEVMARHAGRVLEAMTVRQAAALWAPRSAAASPPRPGQSPGGGVE